jgi:RNA polymerase sigma factor (sigma-70 family)
MADWAVIHYVKDKPPWVDRDMIKSGAYEGLWEAAKNFKPSMELRFNTYAHHIIKGRILDAIRELYPRKKSYRIAHQYSYDELIKDEYEKEYIPPFEGLSIKPKYHATRWSVERIAGLLENPVHRKIIVDRFLHKKQQWEIGEELNISESRVCQLESQIMRTLRIRIDTLHQNKEKDKALVERFFGPAPPIKPPPPRRRKSPSIKGSTHLVSKKAYPGLKMLRSLVLPQIEQHQLPKTYDIIEMTEAINWIDRRIEALENRYPELLKKVS